VVIAEHRAERVRGLADRVWRVSGGLLAEGPGAAASGSRAPVVPGQVRLSMEGIRAGYDGRPVFADAGLELRAGEVTALRGANGSGKSLLARVAVGLHPPEAGRVLLDGEDVTALPAERRFPGVAMVPQDPGRHLLTERVDHEVAYALARLGVSEAESAARVAAALERFDLTGLAGRHPLDLSVGERERVALAALLVSEPGVLILDEPTRGMDPSRKAVLASVLADRAAAGAAVLLITHDAGFAATAADRILRIDLVARRA
ncbi:MAG: ABC transporter ATP-binding protein, partial [Miltoncostaeaceae bacterium]